MTIHKNYILDEHKNPIAIIIPIQEFEKIENIIEDYGLSKLIDETKDEETLSVNDAKSYYNSLSKDVED